jgi:transposase
MSRNRSGKPPKIPTQQMRCTHTYGLLRGSFQPKGEIAVLRAYLRQRERLLEYAAAHIQHMAGKMP